MANTEGGGALIVGVDDRTGQLIGSDTDADWLRRRLYELTERKLSTEIRQVRIAGTRLLVISVPQAVEPVPFNGRYRQRVGRSCVLVTSTELLQGLFAGAAADPSHRRSGHSMDDIAEGAVASLRRRISVATVSRHLSIFATCSPGSDCSTTTPILSTWLVRSF